MIRITNWNELRAWSTNGDPCDEAYLCGTIVADGGAVVVISEGKTLTIPTHDDLIDFANNRNAIQMDGVLGFIGARERTVFLNPAPAIGRLPFDRPLSTTVPIAEGGHPESLADMASIHGWFSAQERHLTWWEQPGSTVTTDDWRWIQAAIQSGPRVGTARLNTFQLKVENKRCGEDRVYRVARPLSLSANYCQIQGSGRDNSAFSFLYNDWVNTYEPLYVDSANQPLFRVPSMWVMNSHHVHTTATAGFESRVRGTTAYVTTPDTDEFAVFSGYFRPEEHCEVSDNSAQGSYKYFYHGDGANGLIIEKNNVATGYPGAVFFKKIRSAVGSGHCAIRDCWVNFTGGNGLFLEVQWNVNSLWVRDCDTEGCTRLLRQGHGDTRVHIDGIHAFNSGTDESVPYVEVGFDVTGNYDATSDYGLLPSTTTIRNVQRVDGKQNLIYDHHARVFDDGNNPVWITSSSNVGTPLNDQILEYIRSYDDSSGIREFTDSNVHSEIPFMPGVGTKKLTYRVTA